MLGVILSKSIPGALATTDRAKKCFGFVRKLSMLGLVNYTLVASVCCSLVLGASLWAETTYEAASGNASAPADKEEQKGHPFAHIVERNVFALKPPPPPPDPNDQPPPPPPPMAKVVLTGILNVLGPPRALLEVTETEPGKQAAQSQPKKPILREGERDGSIEVVSIDVEKSMVRIKNGGFETNLTFEALKQSGGGAPGAPAAAPPALSASIPAPTGGTAAYQPSSTGRGVVMGGATQLAANNSSYNNNSANPAALGSAQFQRQLRVSQTQPQQQPQQVDGASQLIELKARELAARQNNQMFPPLPPIPGLDDQPSPTPTPDTPPLQTGPRPGPPGFPPLPPVPPR